MPIFSQSALWVLNPKASLVRLRRAAHSLISFGSIFFTEGFPKCEGGRRRIARVAIDIHGAAPSDYTPPQPRTVRQVAPIERQRNPRNSGRLFAHPTGMPCWRLQQLRQKR